MMKLVNAVAIAVVLLAMALGTAYVVLPVAQAAWTAQRLNAVFATGADGRQFRLIDVLEQVAGQAVQQAVEQQKQAAEAKEGAK